MIIIIILRCPECNSINLIQTNIDSDVKCKDCGFEGYVEEFRLDEIEKNKIVIQPDLPKRSGKDIVNAVKDKYNKLYGGD